MIDASARQSSEDLTLERTYWPSTGIEISGMSRAESAPAMIADAFHQVGSLDRLRAAYAAPHWDWVQHAFPSCIFTQLRRIRRREVFKYWVQARWVATTTEQRLKC
jgi:hypothetical protein